jgi:hypothetical protein
MVATYDPPTAVLGAKRRLEDALRGAQLAPDELTTLGRVVETRCRLIDVRAQLLLHRRLKRWLVAHVATASALVVLVLFHVATAMTLIP